MSMGVTAYITSQIIIQLLQADVVPKLTQWSKEGETGRRKLDQTIRTLTVILGFIQALGIALGINQLTNGQFVIGSSWRNYFVIALLMTSGTFIAMWLADQITEKGLGNGISVIIATGIIAKFPSMTVQVIQNLNSSKLCVTNLFNFGNYWSNFAYYLVYNLRIKNSRTILKKRINDWKR